MTDWPAAALSDLVEYDSPITYGVVKPGNDPADGVLFIRGGDIADGRINVAGLRRIGRDVSEQYRRTLLRGGELVVSLVGNPGQVAVVPDKLSGANIARQVGLVRLTSDVDTQFVKYFLLSRKGQEALGAQSLGSVQQVINLRDLKTINVPVPPLDEQRAIASVLGALDDKIEQNRRTAQALEKLARAIFRAWFVDFEPVKAKAAGATSFPSMPQPVFDALPTRLVDSDIGPVPEGWVVGSFNALVRERKERIDASPDTEAMLYVPIDCISSRQIFLKEFKSGAEAKTSLVKFYSGDILFGAMRAYFHKVCLAPFEGTTRTTCFVLEPRSAHDRSYSLMLASDKATIDFATSHSVGSTIPYAKWEGALANMPCMLATPSTRKAYGAIVDAMLLAGADGERQSRNLAQMRDYLLPKLLSGQIRVRAAERAAATVA